MYRTVHVYPPLVLASDLKTSVFFLSHWCEEDNVLHILMHQTRAQRLAENAAWLQSENNVDSHTAHKTLGSSNTFSLRIMPVTSSKTSLSCETKGFAVSQITRA